MIALKKSVSKSSKSKGDTAGVSKILKNLETEMGSQLFVRDKMKVLTESGKRFLVYTTRYRRILRK